MKNQTIIMLVAIAIMVVAVVYLFHFKNIFYPPVAHTQNQEVLMTIQKEEFEAKYLTMRENGAQLIDVRTQQEWDAGHYEEADALIDFYAPDFAQQLDALDKSTQYFIYCRSGSRSGMALRTMRSLGFTKVYDLAGGISNAQDILTIVQ